MVNIVKVLSSELNQLQRLIIKVLRFGKTDVRTALNSAPFGIDSNPVKGMKAIYSETQNKGERIIIGYINEKVLAEPGSTRIYSSNNYIHVRENGAIEIGGSDANLVRFQDLDTSIQKLAQDINTELAKIATGISAGGGSYSPTPVQIDINDSKTEEIKCQSKI